MLAQTRKMNPKVNAGCSTPGTNHRVDMRHTFARSAPTVLQEKRVAQEGTRHSVRENETEGTTRSCAFVQSVKSRNGFVVMHSRTIGRHDLRRRTEPQNVFEVNSHVPAKRHVILTKKIRIRMWGTQNELGETQVPVGKCTQL